MFSRQEVAASRVAVAVAGSQECIPAQDRKYVTAGYIATNIFLAFRIMDESGYSREKQVETVYQGIIAAQDGIYEDFGLPGIRDFNPNRVLSHQGLLVDNARYKEIIQLAIDEYEADSDEF